MRVILFGGAGFVGKNLVRSFVERNYDVIVYDRIDNPGFSDRVVYVKGDFSDVDSMTDLIEAGDNIIHLAWNSVPADEPSDPAQNLIADTIPAIRLFSECVKRKASRVIFMSSGGAVYGIPQYVPIDERHPLEPCSTYGINKLTCEEYLRVITHCTQTKGIVLRLANPYGPFQRPFAHQGVIATFLASALLDREICIWGDGSAVRDYLFINDVTEAVNAALSYNGSETVFNVASGKGNSVSEIAETVERITGKSLLKTTKQSYAAEVGKNVLDCSLIHKELGWYASTSLENGIRIMLDSWDPSDKQFSNYSMG